MAVYQALNAVLRHEEPAYIESLKQDMERARMQAEDMLVLMDNVAVDLRGAQQEAMAVLDLGASSSRADLRRALCRANNAMAQAYLDLERESEMEKSSDE